jgi:hypothetical protein
MNNPTTAVKSASENGTETDDSLPFLYPIIYSANFKIGTLKHAAIVLELWKDFDDNTLDNGTHVFADEVRMDFADGTSFSGNRNDFMDVMKQQRKTFKAFISYIDAVVSLAPQGKNETWACVWGKQVSETIDYKHNEVLINENWMFDAAGKVSYIRQFSAVPQPLVG